jgi:type IX secretion system PorP/SprF family membrane protein
MLGLNKYMALSLDSRSQKTGGDFNINSNFVSLSYPFLNRSTGRAWSGLGISMMDDRSGGIYQSQEAAISYAVNIRLSRYQILSVGFKGLFQTRRIDLDGYVTGQQYVPDRGFDQSLSNGESLSKYTNSFSTFSTGLYWQQVDRKENVIGYWGVSIFDINKPNDSFLGSESQLSSTIVFNGGVRAYQNQNLSILPELLYTISSSNHVINVGARWQYQIKQLQNKVDAKVDILTKYVVGRSGIIGAQWHKENFSFGLSYDFPLFNSNPANLGALEVGLEIRKLVLTKNKNKNSKKNSKDSTKKKKKKPSKKTKKTVPTTVPIKTSKPVATKQPNDSDSIVVKSDDSNKNTMVPAIAIVKPDTLPSNPTAEVGKLKHEPLIVEKITLHFQFDYNSVDLDDETEDFIKQLSETLQEDKELKVKITGHTDNKGPAKFNEKLSLKRAETVKSFLLKNGISIERQNAEGKGMSAPITENETETGRRKNRRVEILLYYQR